MQSGRANVDQDRRGNGGGVAMLGVVVAVVDLLAAVGLVSLFAVGSLVMGWLGRARFAPEFLAEV